MDRLTRIPSRENLSQLQANTGDTKISLYQPTHRFAPDNRQDTIRYNNLLTKLDHTLAAKYDENTRKKLLRPFRDLANDRDFWNHTLDGVAIFATADTFEAYSIPRTMPELAIVADTFHLKPLRKYLQSSYNYQILSLTLDEIALYEANRNFIRQIDAGPEVPKSIDEALGRDIEREHEFVHSYSTLRAGRVALTQGRGAGRDEREIDQGRWFRAVDNAVTKHVSNPSKLPLVLLAPAEHQGEFRRITQNSYLQPNGININPNAIDEPKLVEEAWKVMEPAYHKFLDDRKEDFNLARSRQQGSDMLSDVARAAANGRVSTLFIEESKIIPGRLNVETGAIESGELSEPDVDDLLDDLGELVENTGGDVYLVPAHHMPTDSGLAAIYRY